MKNILNAQCRQAAHVWSPMRAVNKTGLIISSTVYELQPNTAVRVVSKPASYMGDHEFISSLQKGYRLLAGSSQCLKENVGLCIQLGHSFFRSNYNSLFNNHPVFDST